MDTLPFSKSRTIRSAVTWALLGVVANATTAADANRELKHAMEAYDAGRFHVAEAWLQDAARQGNPQAHEALGFMYWHGQELYEGVDRSRPRALRHLEEAARNGSATAEVALCTIEPRPSRLGALPRNCRALVRRAIARQTADSLTAQR